VSVNSSDIGPIDLLYLLRRRRISFAQWCKTSGIETRTDFNNYRFKIESTPNPEYFISEEMVALGETLPSEIEESNTEEIVDSANIIGRFVVSKKRKAVTG
jgi:hypothetical protein